MKQFETKKVPKSTEKYACKICDFISSPKSHYDRHITTDKHKKRQFETNETKKVPKSTENLLCNCGLMLNSRTSLWRHRQKCDLSTKNYISMVDDISSEENYTTENVEKYYINNETNIKTETAEKVENLTTLVVEVVKQNQEFQKLILEQNKQLIEMSNSTINNNYTCNTNNMNNCNNKTFNLNVFLNETCKDALNMSEFINSVKITMEDLEQVGEQGFINGISNIFIKNLKQLDICKRPIHCSDIKRETLHVKEDNIWTKEEDGKARIRRMIRLIADKNMMKINEWSNLHPECKDSESKLNDKYLGIVSQSMRAFNCGDESEHYSKIIKNIAKEVVIEKT